MVNQRVLEQIELLENEYKYKEAFELCERVLTSHPDDIELLQKTALIAKVLEDNNKSIYYFEKLLEINPSNQIAYSELQDLYFDRDKYKYYSMRAKLRVIENKPESAIDDFKKAIANCEDDNEKINTYFMIASIYRALGKTEKEENQYLLILDYGKNTLASSLLAEIYLKNGDINAAISTLEQAYEHDKDSSDLKKSLGNLYIRVGNLDKASEFVTDDISQVKVLLQQGKNDEAKKILDAYNLKKDDKYYILLAEYYYNIGDTEKCFETIELFSKVSPKNPLTFQMRALCYEKNDQKAKAKYNWGWYNLIKGQPDMALVEFLESNLIEKSVDTLEQIIKIYDMQNDKTTAIEYVAMLVELEPKNTLSLKRLGEFYSSIGDFDSAYEYYGRILEYDENNVSIIIKIANIAEKTGRESDAILFYEKIVKLSRDEKEVKNAQNRLDVLNGIVDESLISKILGLIKRF